MQHARRDLRDSLEEMLLLPQRFRALDHAGIESLIELPQLLLGPATFGHLGEQSAVGQFHIALLAMQLGEDGDLRAEDGRVHRLVQVVDGAAAVALEHVLVLVVVGGQEDDRYPGGLLPRLDRLRQLEAGHAGHADVEDQKGELLDHQREQCLVRGLGPDEAVAGIGEYRFEDGEVLRLVVHDEDVDRSVGSDPTRGVGATLSRRVRIRPLRRRGNLLGAHGERSGRALARRASRLGVARRFRRQGGYSFLRILLP